MIEFTLRHECTKCGNQAFVWHWFGEATPDTALALLGAGARAETEHLTLTCDRCGHVVAMKPKDAT